MNMLNLEVVKRLYASVQRQLTQAHDAVEVCAWLLMMVVAATSEDLTGGVDDLGETSHEMEQRAVKAIQDAFRENAVQRGDAS